jgi:serine/threonine protein kinase/tetratricopeptide (TPR) repeat protein
MPQDPKPQSHASETLLDIHAGVISAGGETLLRLDAGKEHPSVIGKVEHLTGTPVQSVNLSTATTRDNAPGDKSFTERVRAGGSPLTRYEPVKELGRGGMGVVLRVRDNDLRRDVAMKVLRPDRNDTRSDQGKRDLRRFIEEAQITGQLEHPGIVPVHEMGCDAQGRVFFTMKMVRGEPLSEVLRRLRLGDAETVNAWPLDRMLGVFLKICEALDFAHAHNVVHRDLKPANVMLGNFGEVLVMDWGLARVLDAPGQEAASATVSTESTERRAAVKSASAEFTLDGTVVGTPAYMAPEQARGELARIDARTDVFALGAILYEMLCLRPPYEGADATQLIESAAQGIIKTPLARAAKDPTIRYRMAHLPGSKIPRELDAVCMKALSQAQSDRYPSVRTLQAEIENFIAGRPVSVRRDPLAVRMAKWVRRHPTLAASAAAAVVVVLLSAAVIASVVADASLREAEADRKAMDENKSRLLAERDAMDATLKKTQAEKQALQAFEEKAKAEAAAKEAAMAREAALKRRAEATVHYNLGRSQASRVSTITDKQLRTRAASLAEGAFKEALASDPTMAEAAFELGNLYRQLLMAQAIEFYALADKLQRDAGGKGDPRALVYAGDCSREIKHDYEGARKFYSTAAEVDPDDPYAIVGFGFVALLTGRFDVALVRAGQAQGKDNTLWEPWHLEGVVLAQQFDNEGKASNGYYSPELAFKAFSEAIARNRDGGLLYNERGTALMALDRLEEAERDFRRAMELMPGGYAAQSNLVVIFTRQGRYADATDLAAETLREFPEAYELWNAYGNALYSSGMLNDALAAYEKSLVLKPGRVVPLCNCANVARQLGNFDAALSYGEKAVAANAQYPLAWFQLGMAQRVKGRNDEALSSLKRAHELERANATIAGEYFLQLGINGKIDDLQAASESYIADFPLVATGHYWLGRAMRSQKRPNDALAALLRASEINPQWEDAFEQACGVLFELKRHDDARKLALDRVEQFPRFRLGWLVLGITDAIKGNRRGAYENYAKAVEADETYARALILLAEVANDLGLFKEALGAASRYATINPKDPGGAIQAARANEGLEVWDQAQIEYERADALRGGRGSTRAEIERVKRQKRVAVLRAENRQPLNAGECYDLAFLEAYYSRWQHSAAWARRMFNNHGEEITDLQMIYFCAWMEMKAMGALEQKAVEAAPEKPKSPELETSVQGYRKHCLMVLKRLLELGFDKEELRQDPTFKSLHEMEEWKKLVAG